MKLSSRQVDIIAGFFKLELKIKHTPSETVKDHEL